MCFFLNFSIHLFIQIFVHSFIGSFVRLFIRSFVRSFFFCSLLLYFTACNVPDSMYRWMMAGVRGS